MRYAVRDIVLLAREAASAGKNVRFLNIGDPNQFDFRTPDHVMEAICQAVRARCRWDRATSSNAMATCCCSRDPAASA